MTRERAPYAERLRVVDARRSEALLEAEKLAGAARNIGNLRGLAFVLFLVGLASAFSGQSQLSRTLGATLGLLSVAAFLYLIVVHDRRLERQAEKERLALVLEHAGLRLRGQSSKLPDSGADLAPSGHPYASDLDLFGAGSLFQHLSRAHTHFGRQLLARWLTEPTPRGAAELRQSAIEELATQATFRDELEQQALGLLMRGPKKRTSSAKGPDPEPLLQWIETPPELLPSSVYRWGRFLFPTATVLGGFSDITWNTPSLYWIIPLLLGLTLVFRTADVCSRAFWAVSHTEGSFLPYGALLAQIESLEVSSPHLRALQEELRAQSGPGRPGPSAAMKQFKNIVSWYELRHNGMLYPFVDATLLWSLSCTFALEGWKAKIGPNIRRWFEIIAEFEALGSFSGLLADDDHATLPELAPSGAPLSAKALGHPLILSGSRVRNDLPTLAPGQALLVTGSNMSGKSTFLRALGINVVLGQAGGPVIADTFGLPPLNLGTSLRVSDSLLDQTSHFFAEVKKLAAIVEATSGELPVLFLLDEVLHGTNSRERQIGARWVLAELLARHALGVVTTHDEGLCELEGNVAKAVRLFHFRENVAHGEMTFDYKLRPGPVTSGNALRLMRAVGLEVPLEDSGGAPS
jgi:hypothetical protein